METAKKSIVLHWMYSIFVAKTIPKEEFTGKKAYELLTSANFVIEYNKEFQTYLKAVTDEFKVAVKERRVDELMEKYPLPEFVSEEELSEEFEKLTIEEPSSEEVKTSVFNFLKKSDTEVISVKDVLNHLKEKYEMSLKHRKAEIKSYIQDFIEMEEVSNQPEEEDEKMKEEPKKTKPKKKSKKEEKLEQEKILKDTYVQVNNEVEEIKEKIALERANLIKDDGSIDSESEEKIKKMKEEEKELIDRLKRMEITSPSSTLRIISKTSEGRESNLKYLAFLTYYVISPLINVEDPSLEYTFKSYPDISAKFKTDFINLTLKDRYKFASSIIQGRKFRTIFELIKKQEPLNMTDKGFEIDVDVSLTVFQKESKNVEDEIKYNLMKYVSPNLDYPMEIMVKNITTELKRVTRDDIDEKQVQKALGISSDRNMIAEKVHTDQLKNIKDFVKEKYSSLYNDDPEEQAKIQALYDDVRPALYIPDIDFTERLPVEDMIKYVPEMSKMRSEINKLVSIFKNQKNKSDLYIIKKEIETEVINKGLNKSEGTQHELDLVKKKLKNGEISQDIAVALDTFIRLYDTISNLPTKTSDENIFEFNRIEHLPERYRADVEKELRKRVSESMSNLNAFHAKENDVLNKIQIEIDKSDKIDILSIADKINQLETSEEIKTKLLSIIEKDNKINVFLTYKKLNTVILLNPLEYRGIRRAKRVRRTNEEMNELDKIKAQFPKKTHATDYCLTYIYTKPWLNLPKNYKYFLAHPNDLEKEMLDIKERFLFGAKIIADDFKAYENIYVPTTTFWKVYCTQFLVNRDGMYSCDYNAINRDFLNIDTNKYVLGVYNSYNNKDFRIFTKEDFDKECEWFKNNDMGSLTTLDKFSSIDLNINHKLAKISRDYIRNKIKAILILLYKDKNNRTSLIDRDVLKLESELFNTSETNGKRPFFVYIYQSLFLLYLIDPASPLYDFTSFYQQLFLTSKSYSNLVEISKRLYDAIPTLYLLPNPQKTIDIISSKIKYDTENVLRHIREISEPGFKFTSSPAPSFIGDANITSQFHSFDPKRFKNVCSNYNEVKDPYLITTSGNKVVCVGKKQVYDILTNNAHQIASIPEDVKGFVKRLLSVKETSNQFLRIMAMEFVAKDFLSKHYIYINTLKEKYEEDEHVKEALKMLSAVISSELTQNEKVLFIDHLIAEAYNMLLKNIQTSIDTYVISDEIERAFNVEANKRRKLYYNDDLYNNDRDERKKILSSLFNFLENLYGELNDDIKDSIVDYITSKIDIEIKEEKTQPYTKSYNCSICFSKSTDDNLKTYLYSKGKRELAHFCSMKCFRKLSEEKITKDIGKEDIKQIELHILIDRIIAPIKLTYEELIDRTRIAGMSLPENIPFEQAYVSWLSSYSFSDNIWLEYHHSTLDEIAKRFNIQENDVKTLWSKLKNNSDFYSLFVQRLENVAKPYTRYVSESVELFNEECPYPKTLVNEFIYELVEETKEFFADEKINKFSFEDIVFQPFFIAFSKCSDIQNAVDDAKVSSYNIKLLDDVISYYGFAGQGPNENELNEKLSKSLPKYLKKKGGFDLDKFKENPLEYIKEALLRKISIPANTTFEKMMNDDISGKTASHSLRTLMGDMFGLPIETGGFRVQAYKNFLTNIGLLFIQTYISVYRIPQAVFQQTYLKRKPTEKTRKINQLNNKLETLRQKSLDLTTSQINIKTQLESSDGVLSKQLKEQLKEQKSQSAAIEEQMDELKDEINRLVGKTNVKKVAAKKGLFKGGVKPKKVEESKEDEIKEEEVKTYYTEIEVEQILKNKLLLDISNRFPESSNMYSVAKDIGGVLPFDFSKDVLTVAMVKNKKFHTAEEEKQLELQDFEDELVDEFARVKEQDDDEEAFDEDLEDYSLMDENDNEDMLEEDDMY